MVDDKDQMKAALGLTMLASLTVIWFALSLHGFAVDVFRAAGIVDSRPVFMQCYNGTELLYEGTATGVESSNKGRSFSFRDVEFGVKIRVDNATCLRWEPSPSEDFDGSVQYVPRCINIEPVNNLLYRDTELLGRLRR